MGLFDGLIASLPDAKGSTPSAKSSSTGGGEIESLLRNKAAEYDIDPDLFVSLAKRESGLRPEAKNPGSTAGGLFQFIDGTWNRYGNKKDKFDPEANADAAARMLRDHLVMFDGDYSKALAAHHVGAGKAAAALTDRRVGDKDVSTQQWLSDIFTGAGRDNPLAKPRGAFADAEAGVGGYDQIRRGQIAQAESDASPVSTSLKRGLKGLTHSAGLAIDNMLGDSEGAAQRIIDKQAFDQATPAPSSVQKFGRDWDALAEDDYTGMFGTILKNPAGSFNMMLEQTPNSLPGMAFQTVAGVAGRGLMALGPVGAAAGLGLQGLSAFAGNFLPEGGAFIEEQLHKSGVDTNDVRAVAKWIEEHRGENFKGGATKAGVISAVDGVTGWMGMKMLAGPSVRFAKAEKDFFAKNGVNVADSAALQAARAGDAYKAAMQPFAADLVKASEGFGMFKRGVGATALDAMGEGVGEYAGSYAATGDASIKDAVLEGVMGVGQGAAMAGAQYGIGKMSGPDLVMEELRKLATANIAPAEAKPNSPLSNAAQAAQAADPITEALKPISERFADRALYEQIRNHPNLGPDAMTQILSAYRVATNSNMDPMARQAAVDRLGEFFRLFDNQPNFTAGRADAPGVPAVVGNKPSAVGPVDPRVGAIDGEASRVAPNQQQGVVTQSAPALATDERARKAAAAEYEAAYQDLVKAEQLGVSDQELMQRQIAMRNAENRLQEINEAIEANRAKETAEKRGALLDRVLASNPGNPNRAFDRALRLEGFRDSTFTEEEKSKIARFNELRSIQEDGVFSAPNEAGAFGIREKRESAPAGRYQHLADMLSSGWQLANRHQLTGPNGEVYNLKGAGEAQFVRNKLNQKDGNGNQSPRGGAQGGTDQGDFGVGGAGANGPLPQGGGNGSGQANALPDTKPADGAVSEAEATGAGSQPNDPLNQNPTGRLTPLDDPRIAKYAGDLRSMAPDAGYAERGGRNLRDHNDNFTSRTVWIPTAEWFLPGMLNSPQASVDAVERAIRGYPMKKKEKLHVQGMMDFLDMQYGIDGESHTEQLATLSDIAYEGESADAQNIIDTLGDVDLESNGAWADEVESMRALGFTEEEINEITRRKQGAFGSVGEEAAGVSSSETQGAIPEGDGNGNGQAEGQEGFSLDQQTNEEAAAQFAQQQAGESSDITKEQADKERDAVPFSMQMQSQPKPQGTQVGLFTADGRPSVAAKQPEQSASFDSESWDKARESRIKASKQSGAKHLDNVPVSVESMRGKEIYYVHDHKQRGVIRTVDNRGNVYIYWSDKYSAEKELASESIEDNKAWLKTSKKLPYMRTERNGKTYVFQSSIGASDLKDYVLAGSGSDQSAKPFDEEARAAERQALYEKIREEARANPRRTEELSKVMPAFDAETERLRKAALSQQKNDGAEDQQSDKSSASEAKDDDSPNRQAVSNDKPAEKSPSELGAESFAEGKQRIAPRSMSAAEKARWYRGWDKANLDKNSSVNNAENSKHEFPVGIDVDSFVAKFPEFDGYGISSIRMKKDGDIDVVSDYILDGLSLRKYTYKQFLDAYKNGEVKAVPDVAENNFGNIKQGTENKDKALQDAADEIKKTEAFYALPGHGMRFGKALREAIISGSQSRLVGDFSVKGGRGIPKAAIARAKHRANKGGQPVAVVQVLDDAGVPIFGALLQVPFKDKYSSNDDFGNRQVIADIGGVGEVVYPDAIPTDVQAASEPNLAAAKALIQEAKDTHGDKRKEAIVRKKARELAQKTPLSDEKTVLALDMVSTRLGMGDGGTKALEFLPAVENAQKPAATAEDEAADDGEALANDFRTYPVKVLSAVIDSGQASALYKAAGVRSADAFSGLPISEQADAYAKFVQDGGTKVEGLPADYNEWVRAQEADAESRRMQGERTIRQANGKPFKTEASAQQAIERFGLTETHDVKPVDGGFELQQLTPAAQLERRRKAEGKESYIEAQAAIMRQLGIEANSEGEYDLSEAQWADVERRVDARLRGGIATEQPMQPENDKPAYADDAELQDALSHLGDVLGDVFGAKLNITGKQYGASDLLPAMSKVIELLIKKGFKSFRESVGAATNAMRGNANTKGFVDQITPRQWKAAYNSVAEFHEGTDSEEDVAKYSAEQIQKIIALPEKIKEAEQATNHDATPGQKEAGNYAKGKFAWHGLNIAVETAKGEDRTDKETNGEKWRVTMPATYGYVLGTVGADKDHVDVFMGDKPESQRVYVVNQTKPGSTEFDEHKIMLGYESEGAAIGDYLLSFSDTFGASVLGSVSGPYTIEQFKEMLAADRFKKAKPISDRLAYVNPRVEEKPVEQQPPGFKTNGTKEKAAAERLAQLLDKMNQVRIDRNTPEGSAKGIVRSVIEELRKERTAVSVSDLLETASQRLSRQHAPFSEVIDQVVESLRSDASPDNKGDIKQAGVSLDKFGLTVRRSQTKNGTPTWEVSGNTRDHVAALRNAGGKWYGPKKVWSFYSEESPEGKILAALGASPAVSGVALSEIEVERKSEGTGRIKTYKQRADEALSEIDERMSLGKQLLECLNS